MSKPRAFWDASALVPLCVTQANSRLAIGLLQTYDLAVWWATRVEIASALARLLRDKNITPSSYTRASIQADGLSNLWRVVSPSASVAREARSLLEIYPLSAADALQLGAAIVWCEGKPAGKVFLTFDKRLREAAGLSGFLLA